jgi:hypothetical protein
MRDIEKELEPQEQRPFITKECSVFSWLLKDLGVYAACDTIQIPPTNSKRGPKGTRKTQAKQERNRQELEQRMQGHTTP